MSKYILALLLVCALAGGGYWYLNQGQSAPPPVSVSPAQPVASPIPRPAEAGETDVLLKQLAGDTRAVFRVFPRGVDIGLEKLTQFQETLLQTKLAKKLGLKETMAAKFKAGFNEKLDAVDPADAQKLDAFINNLEQVQTYWKSLREVTVVVSGQSQNFKIQGRDFPFPYLLVRAGFQSEADAKSTFEQLAANLLDQANPPPPTVKVKRGSDTAIEIELSDPQSGSQLMARLLLSGPEVTFVTGEQWESKFFSSQPALGLVTSPEWQTVRQVRTPSAAVEFYASPAILAAYAEDVIGKLPPEAQKNFEAAQLDRTLSLYRNLTAVGGVFDFSSGSTVRSCALAKPDSDMARAYDKIMQARGTAKPTDRFSTVLDAQTIAATRFAVATLAASLRLMLEQLQFSAGAGVSEKQRGQLEQVVHTAEEILNRFEFQEAGAFLAPPLMPPIIGAGVFFGGSKLAGDDLIIKFADALNEIAALFDSFVSASGAAPGVKLAKAVKKQSGGMELQLVLGGLKLVGGLVDEHSVAISIDSSIVGDLAAKARAGKSYFSKYDSPPGLETALAESDYYFYLNTDQLVALLRTFLPALAAAQPAGQKVEVDEIDEILNLARIDYLGYQRSFGGANGAVCSESHSFFLSQ